LTWDIRGSQVVGSETGARCAERTPLSCARSDLYSPEVRPGDMWWFAVVLILSMLPGAPHAHAGCHGVEAQAGNDMRCLRPKDTFRDCVECPEMVVLSAGSFIMGSPASEEARLDNEGPQHKITIARPFAVGRFEVTFDEWDACVFAGGCLHQPDDAGWGRGRRPVIDVSWDDITNEYLPWLSRKAGKTYRLLTEAEWEYAARAGTSTPFSTGWTITPDQANFHGFFTYGGSARGVDRNQTLESTETVRLFGDEHYGRAGRSPRFDRVAKEKQPTR